MLEQERKKVRHLLSVKDPEGIRVIYLEAATYSIGRDPKNAIYLRSKSVSRQHAMLLRVTAPDQDRYFFRIIDGSFTGKKSTNGIFVNGQRCSARDLKHGDFVEFGDLAEATYYAVSNLTDLEFAEICESNDPLALLTNSEGGGYNTVVADLESNEDASAVALARLASFPELTPSPIIEVEIPHRISYLNPAATSCFPDLPNQQLKHPLLSGLFDLLDTHFKGKNIRSLTRTVEVGEQTYEQFIHYMAESDLVRLFLTDITERRQVELELKRRDQLMAAVSSASTSLLTELDYELAISQALKIIGEAAEVDRVLIYENYPHPSTGEVTMRLRQEWTKPGIRSLLPLLGNQVQSYSIFGVQHWYQALNEGRCICGSRTYLSISEQTLLGRDQVQALMIVPIRLGRQCWGFIAFHDCTSERQWSSHEESILFAMAASLGGAIQRQQTEEVIRYRASHDLLTGLPNRAYFDEKLAQALKEVRRDSLSPHYQLAVLFLDLDQFKGINDTLGHTIGDELLREVAKRIKEIVNENTVFSRWGGDEFTLLIPNINRLSQATQEAASILNILEPAFNLHGNELFISASIGIAIYGEDSPDAESLIKHADLALYRAKSLGRNNYQVYDRSMATQSPETLAIERKLRFAIDRNEFVLYYQPQVDINTQKIVGVEALIRWNSPESGFMSPGVFIPLAESSGLIIPIGEWVLRQACQQAKEWQRWIKNIRIGVNLSPKQFRQSRLIETIAQILQETELEPEVLELEITESAAIEDFDYTQAVMKELKQLGIHLSIDDFGTGHSSLSRLQFLPLNTLKIDQSFLRDLSRNTKAPHILSSIVSLGQGLGLKLIAEGVENATQVEFLQSIHCDCAQGFFFHKPLPAEQVDELLKAQSLEI
jgi:diguanylate cyclase (GGDEF)-like protein